MTANNLRDAMINELGEASELLPPLEKKKLFKKKKYFTFAAASFRLIKPVVGEDEKKFLLSRFSFFFFW